MTLPWIAPSACHAQLHSHDRYLRLRPSALARLVFRHGHTVQDPSILQEVRHGRLSSLSAGFTEWVADSAQGRLSLGWDWIRLHDGGLQLLREVAPRSNLRLTDARGYDLSHEDNTAQLWQLLQRIDWRPSVQTRLDMTPA